MIRRMGVSNRGLFHRTGEVLPTPLCIEIYGFTYKPNYFKYLKQDSGYRAVNGIVFWGVIFGGAFLPQKLD